MDPALTVSHNKVPLSGGGKLPFVTLTRGTKLYRQSFRKPTSTSTGSLDDDGLFSFYALQPSYGDDASYGPIHSVWTLQDELKLLNIGTVATRRRLREDFGVSAQALDCDNQYSGGAANRAAHRELLPVLKYYKADGTIIRDADSDEDCEGPNEVVVRQRIVGTKVQLDTIRGGGKNPYRNADGSLKDGYIVDTDCPSHYATTDGKCHSFRGSGAKLTYKQKFNKKYGFARDAPHSLREIAKITGYRYSGLKTIFEKGEGAFETAGPSRPNMQKQQWAYARVYAALDPSSKAHRIDKVHLRGSGRPKLDRPFPSKHPVKKYSVYVKADNEQGYKLIHFGARGMDDWRSGTATSEQRRAFRARLKGIKKKDGSYAYKDKGSPAYWSLNYSW